MKNKLNLLIFFLFISLNIFSQDKIEFDFSSSALDETVLEEETYIPQHFLGSEVSRKIKLLDLAYKWIDPPSATRNTSIIQIEKQPIYFALKKIINPKFYKNKIKNKKLTKEDAIKELSNIIDIGLMIRYQETSSLETLLRPANAEGVIEIFNNKILIRYY